MEHPSGTRNDYDNRTRGGGVSPARRAGSLIAALVGSVAGGLLVVPLAVVSPDWLFLTVPLVVSAMFASGFAYLLTVPSGASFARICAATLLAAVVCGVVNLTLLGASSLGLLGSGDLLLPGGWVSHLLEAIVIGATAWIAATRATVPERRSNLSLGIALLLSVMAIVVLLAVGSAVLPGSFNG